MFLEDLFLGHSSRISRSMLEPKLPIDRNYLNYRLFNYVLCLALHEQKNEEKTVLCKRRNLNFKLSAI